MIVILLLSSCSKQSFTCYTLFREISESVTIGKCEVYPYRSDLQDASFFSRLYSGKSSDAKPHAFSYCDDYYVVLSSSSDLWELHIFHAISQYDVDAVKEMLIKRRDRLQKNDPASFYSDETYERISRASVFSVESYVILAITDHNSEIETILRELLI